ncbi:hypothetical protein OG429_02630 [Streptomyces sp. NBC_00190]|uniref:hypothetical protein n=1 Tax=unclassified Streptomyces TaxID=2593676 RepID=UPI002E28D02C|nr:hypothetical protein [Streptomyces sp. NBC_00190]WSZ38312.1 hypothetical protein OG239_05640 [Streptomyces sp. NBC_00868]
MGNTEIAAVVAAVAAGHAGGLFVRAAGRWAGARMRRLCRATAMLVLRRLAAESEVDQMRSLRDERQS